MRRQREEVACVRCGNVDDLHGIQDALYCVECRTCPHGKDIVEMPCDMCLRDRHSVWTFQRGPMIVNLRQYVFEASLYGVSFFTWNMYEEGVSAGMHRGIVTALRGMNREERTAFMLPPYPLLHLMSRRMVSLWPR